MDSKRLQFGSIEASIIRTDDLDKEANTLENFTDILFDSIFYIDQDSNFTLDKIVGLLETFEDIDKIKEDEDLFNEVMRDAQYFINALKDIEQKVIKRIDDHGYSN